MVVGCQSTLWVDAAEQCVYATNFIQCLVLPLGDARTGGGSCCTHGPGYASPLAAMKGPRETILYIPCIQSEKGKHDYVAVVDVDPSSATYSQV